MNFGKRAYDKGRRGVPAGLKRQILLLGALLFGVGLLGIQFLGVMNRRGATGMLPGGGAPGFGTELPSDPSEEESSSGFPLPRIGEPDPFQERPEILERGNRVDKKSHFDDKLIAYLLQKVRTREGFYSEKPVLSLDEKNEEVWQRLTDEPDKHRGELVEVKGEILSPEPGRYPLHLRGIDSPNPSGLDRAYQSYLIGVDGKYYMVATARKQRNLAHRDAVRLRGYFCQLYSYGVEYRGERRRATIPFLVGDDYELLETPKAGSPWTGDYLPLLGAFGLFAVVGVLLLEGRRDRRYQARRIAGKVRRIQRAREPGSPENGSPLSSRGKDDMDDEETPAT